MILNLGSTHEVQEMRQRRDRLQHASAVLNIMLDGVRRSGRAPVCSWLSVARSLPRRISRSCFIIARSTVSPGGSVFERLAVQSAITLLVRRFKGLLLHAGDTAAAKGFGPIVGVSAAMRELFRADRADRTIRGQRLHRRRIRHRQATGVLFISTAWVSDVIGHS